MLCRGLGGSLGDRGWIRMPRGGWRFGFVLVVEGEEVISIGLLFWSISRWVWGVMMWVVGRFALATGFASKVVFTPEPLSGWKDMCQFLVADCENCACPH